ncbi:MAG: dethiobiotin synthase [Gammaproteobacteria bacterium]|nr:dethiobiotin synthase [Gammaproteobacteria bacterium]
MASGVFITGTDTNVGKTFFGSRFTHYLYKEGIHVAPCKPIESGCQIKKGFLFPADGAAYAAAINQADAWQHITPFRYAAVTSPARAATLSAQTLNLADVLNIIPQAGFRIIEGAGGLCSPLSHDALNIDLAVALNFPLLLIASDRLGCLNHCLLSLRSAAQQQLSVAGIVLNQTHAADTSGNNDLDNAAELAQYTDLPIWSLPYAANPNHISAAQENIFAAVWQRLTAC